MATLVLVFKKIESEDKTKYDTFYSNSKAEIIINEKDIDDVFESIYTTITSLIQKSLVKGSVWTIIDSIIDHNISIPKYNLLAGSNYRRLPKELDHSRKGLTNMQNIDDHKCKSSTAWITKTDKYFAEKFYFKGTKLPVKIRDVKKKKEKKYVDLLLIGKEGKRRQVLLKILILSLDHTLHRGKKCFYRYCLQAFSTREILP